MAYATVAEYVEMVSEAEARLQAPVTPTVPGGPTHDDAKIAEALSDASAVLDTYLGSRYPTPIANPPRTLAKATIDLARETLDRTGRAPVIAAAARARSWVRDIANGVATLGQGDPAGPPPPPSTGGAAVRAAPATFDDQQLTGYLPRFAPGGRMAGGWSR